MVLFLKKLKILFLRQIGHLLRCWVDGLQILCSWIAVWKDIVYKAVVHVFGHWNKIQQSNISQLSTNFNQTYEY